MEWEIEGKVCEFIVVAAVGFLFVFVFYFYFIFFMSGQTSAPAVMPPLPAARSFST